MIKVADLADEAERTADSQRLRELSEHKSPRVRRPVAANAASEDQVVERLLDDDVEVVRLAAATNLADRSALQQIAVNSPDRWIRAILAHTFRWQFDRALPYDIQAKLASDEFFESRVRMAETTNYLDLFESLIADSEPRVRAGAASNPRITRDQMQRLVTDPAAVVRAYAAANGLLFPDTEQLMRLAADRSAKVRWNVIFRVDRPREALELIAEDQDETNRRHARALLDSNYVDPAAVEGPQRTWRQSAGGLPPFENAPDLRLTS